MWGLGDDNPEAFDFKVGKETEVRRFLRGARPSWAPKDLEKVELKLSKIGVKSLDSFKAALSVEAEPSLNSQLQAAGEKGFAAETLGALRGQVDKPLPEAQVVLNRKQAAAPPPAPPPPPPPATTSDAKHPEEAKKEEAPPRPAPQPEVGVNPGISQQFEVVSPNVAVHNRPDEGAQWLGRRLQGQSVWGEEETFDGWVKLVNNKGWVKRAQLLQDGKSFEYHLQPVGHLLPLPTGELSERPGLRQFQVVHDPHVPVRSAPSSDAAPLSVKKYGDIVSAETQRYDGWVRLAEGKGWMRSWSKETGPLLVCSYFEHLASWNDTVKMAKVTLNPTNDNIVNTAIKDSFYREYGREPGDLQMLRGAIMGAKAYGRVPRVDIKKAEVKAEALRWGRGDGIISAPEEAQEDKSREREEEQARNFALESIAVGIAAGDTDAIKAAVNKAKELGVPKKEIARAYALANGNINLAER